MKKVTDFLFLKKEAYLFDAKLYILKAFAAVLTAYTITLRLPLVHKDIISMLFGLMMTLEPVTVTGIRSGFKQITATLLGALTTAIVITVLGINIFTVALSVSATLFLCLKIEWREVSPVAIFTSIYMTQYVQYTSGGEPSILLTFLLRILALGVGILFAVAFNFLFASFFYKRLERKRLAYILSSLTEHMKQVKKGIDEFDMEQILRQKELLPGTFIGIDWLTSLIKDKEKEARLKKRLHLNSRYEETVAFQKTLIELRNATHMIYDSTYMLSFKLRELDQQDRVAVAAGFEHLIGKSGYLASHCETHFIRYSSSNEETVPQVRDPRLNYNLDKISKLLDLINDLC
jgi:uncharacterized membrane protein YgaE (UPF0421/DUF939 family)